MSGSTPLAVRPFRRVWVGFTVSAAGDAASWIALVSLCLGPARGNLAVLAALYTAPVAVGGLAAGWVLDRFDRRVVIALDSVVRGAVFASIPVTALFGSITDVQLYLVAAVYGLLKMISLAGFPSLIPSLVEKGLLEQANALEGMSFGLASLAGAALSGLGVATVGAVPVIVFDTASYLVLAVSLLSIGGAGTSSRKPQLSTGPARRRGGTGEIVKLAITHRVLRSTTVMFALFNVGEGCLLVFLPHRAVGLGLGVGGYGYLVAATTGGGMLAGIVLARRPWRWSLRSSIVAAQLAGSVSILALLVPSTLATVAGLVLLGVFSTPMTAWAQTLRMRVVPPASHGRLFAVLRTTMQGTPPLGAGLGAALAPHGTTVTVLAVAAVAGVPALLLGPGLARSQDPDPGEAPSHGLEGDADEAMSRSDGKHV